MIYRIRHLRAVLQFPGLRLYSGMTGVTTVHVPAYRNQLSWLSHVPRRDLHIYTFTCTNKAALPAVEPAKTESQDKPCIDVWKGMTKVEYAKACNITQERFCNVLESVIFRRRGVHLKSRYIDKVATVRELGFEINIIDMPTSLKQDGEPVPAGEGKNSIKDATTARTENTGSKQARKQTQSVTTTGTGFRNSPHSSSHKIDHSSEKPVSNIIQKDLKLPLKSKDGSHNMSLVNEHDTTQYKILPLKCSHSAGRVDNMMRLDVKHKLAKATTTQNNETSTIKPHIPHDRAKLNVTHKIDERMSQHKRDRNVIKPHIPHDRAKHNVGHKIDEPMSQHKRDRNVINEKSSNIVQKTVYNQNEKQKPSSGRCETDESMLSASINNKGIHIIKQTSTPPVHKDIYKKDNGKPFSKPSKSETSANMKTKHIDDNGLHLSTEFENLIEEVGNNITKQNSLHVSNNSSQQVNTVQTNEQKNIWISETEKLDHVIEPHNIKQSKRLHKVIASDGVNIQQQQSILQESPALISTLHSNTKDINVDNALSDAKHISDVCDKKGSHIPSIKHSSKCLSEVTVDKQRTHDVSGQSPVHFTESFGSTNGDLKNFRNDDSQQRCVLNDSTSVTPDAINESGRHVGVLEEDIDNRKVHKNSFTSVFKKVAVSFNKLLPTHILTPKTSQYAHTNEIGSNDIKPSKVVSSIMKAKLKCQSIFSELISKTGKDSHTSINETESQSEVIKDVVIENCEHHAPQPITAANNIQPPKQFVDNNISVIDAEASKGISVSDETVVSKQFVEQVAASSKPIGDNVSSEIPSNKQVVESVTGNIGLHKSQEPEYVIKHDFDLTKQNDIHESYSETDMMFAHGTREIDKNSHKDRLQSLLKAVDSRSNEQNHSNTPVTEHQNLQNINPQLFSQAVTESSIDHILPNNNKRNIQLKNIADSEDQPTQKIWLEEKLRKNLRTLLNDSSRSHPSNVSVTRNKKQIHTELSIMTGKTQTSGNKVHPEKLNATKKGAKKGELDRLRAILKKLSPPSYTLDDLLSGCKKNILFPEKRGNFVHLKETEKNQLDVHMRNVTNMDGPKCRPTHLDNVKIGVMMKHSEKLEPSTRIQGSPLQQKMQQMQQQQLRQQQQQPQLQREQPQRQQQQHPSQQRQQRQKQQRLQVTKDKAVAPQQAIIDVWPEMTEYDISMSLSITPEEAVQLFQQAPKDRIRQFQRLARIRAHISRLGLSHRHRMSSARRQPRSPVDSAHIVQSDLIIDLDEDIMQQMQCTSKDMNTNEEIVKKDKPKAKEHNFIQRILPKRQTFNSGERVPFRGSINPTQPEKISRPVITRFPPRSEAFMTPGKQIVKERDPSRTFESNSGPTKRIPAQSETFMKFGKQSVDQSNSSRTFESSSSGPIKTIPSEMGHIMSNRDVPNVQPFTDKDGKQDMKEQRQDKREKEATQVLAPNQDWQCQPPADASVLVKRPPIVTIMGHVDHGKTTLLDALRQSNVVDQEFGGITQHIGAFKVNLPAGEVITFLDTPGHAAFWAMRARGATVTDLVVLVVAAEDSVMPQTIESIQHARESGVPVIVAINKIDKTGVNVDRVKRDLLTQDIVLEDFGGDVQSVAISALKRINLDKLLASITVQAELMDLRGDPVGLVEGHVVEARSDVGRGRLVTALIQRGTLKKGSLLVAGTAWTKVRTIYDDQGKIIGEAGPATPVEITGWKELPTVGEQILQIPTEKLLKQVLNLRNNKKLEEKSEEDATVIEECREEHHKKYAEARKTLKTLSKQFRRKITAAEVLKYSVRKESDHPELSIIVKADVDGSLEALLHTLDSYSCEKCRLNIVHFGVGDVTPGDLELAASFGGHVYCFHVKEHANLDRSPHYKEVPIKHFNVIYQLFDDLKETLNSKLPTLIEEDTIGEGRVLEVFDINSSKKDTIQVAGCRCTSGSLIKKNQYRITRNGQTVYEGPIMSLKHHKKDVPTIKTDVECGICVDPEHGVAFQPEDLITCFVARPTHDTIDWELGF